MASLSHVWAVVDPTHCPHNCEDQQS